MTCEAKQSNQLLYTHKRSCGWQNASFPTMEYPPSHSRSESLFEDAGKQRDPPIKYSVCIANSASPRRICVIGFASRPRSFQRQAPKHPIGLLWLSVGAFPSLSLPKTFNDHAVGVGETPQNTRRPYWVLCRGRIPRVYGGPVCLVRLVHTLWSDIVETCVHRRVVPRLGIIRFQWLRKTAWDRLVGHLLAVSS